MITEAKIENFKCFEALHLPELGLVNLVGGANNVGKTALLEALYIFYDRLNPKMFPNQYAWRGLPQIALRPDHIWGPCFRGLDLGRTIRVSVRSGSAGWEWAEYNYKADFVRAPRDNGSEGGNVPVLNTEGAPPGSGCLEVRFGWPDGKTGVIRNVVDDGNLGLEVDRVQYRLPAAIVPARTRVSLEEETGRLSAVKEAKKGHLVERFLSVMGPVSDLQVSSAMGRPVIFCDIGLSRLVPLAFAGDGVGRVLSMILSMMTCPNGLVLIDEVENGVHHAVQERFWKAISEAAREIPCQVIATTHSHECLQAAHAAFTGLLEPDFRFIRLEKAKDDIVAKTFTHEMLGLALDANLEVR